MAASKVKSETEREQVLAFVAKLDRRGYTQFDIKYELQRELGIDVSQPMISIYLKQIRLRYREQQIIERRVKVNEKVEQLRDIRREAWDAWRRSSEDATKMVEEFGSEMEAVGQDDYVTSERLLKRISTSEGRLPDNAYLQTIRAALKDERDLLGLDQVTPATQTNVNVGVGIAIGGAEFWVGLSQQVARALPSVEQRVVEAVGVEEIVDDDQAQST